MVRPGSVMWRHQVFDWSWGKALELRPKSHKCCWMSWNSSELHVLARGWSFSNLVVIWLVMHMSVTPTATHVSLGRFQTPPTKMSHITPHHIPNMRFYKRKKLWTVCTGTAIKLHWFSGVVRFLRFTLLLFHNWCTWEDLQTYSQPALATEYNGRATSVITITRFQATACLTILLSCPLLHMPEISNTHKTHIPKVIKNPSLENMRLRVTIWSFGTIGTLFWSPQLPLRTPPR